MEQSQLDHLKGALEALLFVSEKPVSIDQFKDAVVGVGAVELKEALNALRSDYEVASKGITIIEIAGGWQMLSNPLFAGYLREFYKTRHKEKLSRPALEALAIIAYKQPVSRTDVEVLRGVNSDGVVMHLLNKGLIKIAGRKEVPGRPYVYGTTQQFLEYFGLRSLEDLPKLEEFPALIGKANEVAATVVTATDTAVVEEGVVSSVAAEEAAPVSTEESDAALAEALARARTKLDIDELEKQARDNPDMLDVEVTGESSGQSRLMSMDNDTKEETHGSDAPSPEN
jgi:segregation and condensation protein B